MVMKMLASGGMDSLIDGVRTANEDNPGGYFELEPVKQMDKDSIWLGRATGKTVKVIAQLLPALPPSKQ